MVEKVSYIPPDLLKDRTSNLFPSIPRIPNLSVVYITKNFSQRFVNIPLTPVLIHKAERPQNIMIKNPSRGAGALPSISGLHTSQVGIVGAGNTQLTPTAVFNYINMQLFLRVTAINAGSRWTFFNQIQDPITLAWTDSQVLVAAVTPAMVLTWTGATFYANIATFGVGTNFALRWTLDAGAGPIDFTLSYILKWGTIGAATGLPQVVYIGSNSGVTPLSGYPFLESEEKLFQVEEGTEIWGIALTPTVINVIELT